MSTKQSENQGSAHSELMISRRRALQLTAGLGAAAMGGGIFSAKRAFAQSPSKGGTARIATEISDATASLDPVRIMTNTDIARAFQVYNTLVRVDEKLAVQPSLAESWEMAKPDATEWVFRLRRGVTFHNGKTFGPSDVVWNLQRHIADKSTSRARPLLAMVSNIQADGPDAVRITLKQPNVDFPVVMAVPYLVMAPEGQADFVLPIGTGPFQMKEFTPGGSSLAVRNDNYWNAGNVFLDSIELIAIADPANRINGILAGDLDFAMSADVASLPLLDRSGTAETMSVRAGQIVAMGMLCNQAPTSNPDLRLALKYLQDRERVRDSAYQGFAQIANDHPVSPIDPLYCADLPIRPYDVDKAKFHLKKAGMENATLEVYVAPGVGPGLIDQMLLYQQTAAPAGVTIKVNQVPGEGYWNAVWMKHPLTSTHANTRPRADMFWSVYLSANATVNETQFFDPRIDNLLNAARSEVDEARRKQHWCDLQTIVHNDGGYMEAAFPDYLHAKSKRLQGVVAHPTAGLSDFLSGEGWWFSA